MWTVTVTLPNGETETYADEARNAQGLDHPCAFKYTYEVDPSTDVLRIFRRWYLKADHVWSTEETPEEVSYYRPAAWSHVRRGD